MRKLEPQPKSGKPQPTRAEARSQSSGGRQSHPREELSLHVNHTNKQNKNHSHHGPSSQQIKDSNHIRLCYPETIKINTSMEEKQLCMGCHSTSYMDGPLSISQDQNYLTEAKKGRRKDFEVFVNLLKNWFKVKEDGITCNRKIKLLFSFVSRRV